MIKRRICYIILFLFCFGINHAQDIEVKKFEPLEKDQTAALSSRKDINGADCALVLVESLKKGLEFEGWVVGDVEYKNDSYFVYMANGSKNLKIKHPDYQTKAVAFGDYGIGSLKGGQMYKLSVVDETKDIINKVYSLGWNLNGFDVPEKARTFLNMSARRGDRKAIVALLLLSDKQEEKHSDDNSSLHWIEQLLSKGDSSFLDSMPARYMLLFSGKIKSGIRRGSSEVAPSVKRDLYTKASEYELKACLKGCKEAGDYLFEDYLKGKGLPMYKHKVLDICKDSANSNNLKAMECLGRIYERGFCETVDLNMAAEWYKKAHDLSPSSIMKSNLCRIYGNPSYKIDSNNLEFIRKMAEEGLAEAKFQLGCMYEEGRNFPQNREKSIELFSQISHRGATYHLAKFAFDQKDYKKAENLLKGMIFMHNDDNKFLYEDDALFLYAVTRYNLYTYSDARVSVLRTLSELSKKGYQKAAEFIKENY